MTDNKKLKVLCEAAPTGPWLVENDSLYFKDDGYTRHLLEADAGHDVEDEAYYAALKFIAAANPSAVLALIAENDRLKTLRSTTERDLAQELEVWRNGPSCWSCSDTGDVHDIVGEWRGQCDCNATKLIDAASERDQLKAENAGLRTGYEAYEQVNAELKAENEALRDYLNLRVSAMPRDRLREIFNTAYYGPRELGSDGEQCRAGVLAVIGAAMGQGKQS
ncbi:hypothetical protein IQK56_07295 [Pseudomonas sp. MAFF 301449]|uniref:Ead/Ea22-like family protein n=1 Tax=Pseudomonas cyclaminis TaxID=2781239 RepID=A0ABR9SP84_9PSED|nr:hypothetical protein [Pseudomonas cyclaminis]MBE8590750.1 hypothetical protein [Pseudomonas cyclaminis]MBE8598693.1 hypothetical protein [Pseudomonas cyclaminis]